MKATATLRYIKVSPQKARLVVDQIRGKKAGEAVQILAFSRKAVAKPLLKLLRSVISNAANKEFADTRQSCHQQGHGRHGADDEAVSADADGPGRPHPEADEHHHAGTGLREATVGQKVHPIGFRLGYTKTWESRWFSTKGYVRMLHEDIRIRRFLKSKLSPCGNLEGRDRAGRQADYREHLHRAARDRHRQEGRRGRKAQGRAGEDDRHRRYTSTSSEVRRPEIDARSRRRERGAAAREAGLLPSRHEEGGLDGPPVRRQGRQDPLRGTPVRRGDRPLRMVPSRGAFPCRRCGPTSTTASPRPGRRTARSA